MTKVCDHTSVGMVVRNGEQVLLIERAKFPFGFAIPAGHVDDDASFEEAAKRELQEEVGLTTENLILITEGRKNNPCRREGGTWHEWKIYEVQTDGDINPSKDETKRVGWYGKEDIQDLAQRTEQYLAHQITVVEWEQAPGLEPVMYEWFKELDILN